MAFTKHEWRKARKQYTCDDCCKPIKAGDTYCYCASSASEYLRQCYHERGGHWYTESIAVARYCEKCSSNYKDLCE